VSQQQGASEIWSGLETLGISDVSVLSVPFCKQLTSLRCLEFFCQGTEHREIMVSLTEEEERALQLLTSLQKLSIRRCPNLLSLPANLHSLTSLQELTILSCPNLLSLPNLHSLTSLKTLYIFHCTSITRLPDLGVPPLLRRIWLSGCSEELGMCYSKLMWEQTVLVRGDDQPVGNPKRKV
jgi:hypothetical protein